MMDLNAERCRHLWADVVMTALDDYNLAHVKARRQKAPLRSPADIEADARMWLRSAWAQKIMAMAGIEMRMDLALDLIRLPRAMFKARTHALGHRGEEAA